MTGRLWGIFLVLAVVFIAGYVTGRAIWKHKYDVLVLEYKTAQEEAIAKAETTRMQWGVDKANAVAEAARKGKENEKAADAARVELDRLRKLFSESGRLSGASGDAGAVNASATGAVLAECGERYAEMARTADGHAADVKMLQDAWPRKKDDSSKDN